MNIYDELFDLVLEANGTGNISVNDHRITNIADAVDNKDAVSKGFLNTTSFSGSLGLNHASPLCSLFSFVINFSYKNPS